MARALLPLTGEKCDKVEEEGILDRLGKQRQGVF